MSKFMSKAEGAELGITIAAKAVPTLSVPASAVAGTATPGCFHPLSCRRCDRAGVACGSHHVGDVGHERCDGKHA